jgi:hypothetical protein
MSNWPTPPTDADWAAFVALGVVVAICFVVLPRVFWLIVKVTELATITRRQNEHERPRSMNS